jgi:hypothetical protein
MTDYTIPRKCRITHHQKNKNGGSLTVYAEDPEGTILGPALQDDASFFDIDFDANGELVSTRLDPRTGLPLH